MPHILEQLVTLPVHEALLRARGASGVDEALCALGERLQDITTLYGDFADRFDLSECKLAIVHCAGHHDPAMVEALWQDVIMKGRCDPKLSGRVSKVLAGKYLCFV